MPENPTPRQMVKGLLQGIAPPRPLFLPIVFSTGARVENLALRAFLGNPTKICNAQRQMRSYLRSDGVSCYFDPFLEVEALGGVLQWTAEHQPPTVQWPQPAEPGELPEDLRSPEEAVAGGRVAVAVDVVRRMSALLRDDSLLMAGVTGPFTLAARLTQLETGGAWRTRELPEVALQLAAEVVTKISGALVEAGANLIVIQEDVLPALSAERCAAWASSLEPACNVVRFYQALPVLLLTDGSAFAANSCVILQRPWDCLLCPTLQGIPALAQCTVPEKRSAALGIALPLETFQLDDSSLASCRASLRQMVAELRPAILTTAGDVPAQTDMKRLIKVLEEVPRGF
ncbi:MAG: hypothetical protein LAN84_03665 [Acidobacteriia bacterium]|nr:hypothetical protein [Terriglobia bacterium]